MLILTNYDFNKNQVQNVAIHNLPSAPTSPVKGQIYFNTVDNRAYIFNGTGWVGADSLDAAITGDSIVTAINGSVSKIDDDNLSTTANSAITNSHVHSNKTVLDATTASFTTTDETKLDGLVTNATHTGDVTGSTALTVANSVITNAKLANVSTGIIKGRVTASAGAVEDLTAAQVRTLLNVADGATANAGTVTSITPGNGMSTSTPITTSGTITLGTPGALTGFTTNSVTATSHTHSVALTKSDVGLANVTNDAQIKKIASSINGYLPTWNGTTGDALASGYSVETTLTGGSGAIPRADAVKTYVDGVLGSNDAMIFKGTLGSGGTITALPTTYSSGWAYKVITAGTYAGNATEIGDLIIAITDRNGTGNVDADWTVVQSNIDGAVTGPASATSGNFAVFSGATGKTIANSTYGPSSFATASHGHGTFDNAATALSGANVYSNIAVADGIVTAVSTRALTAADVGAAASSHTHSAYDRASSVLSGANVFSNIVIADGIVTTTATRALTAADVGAAASSHTHAYAAKYTTTLGNASATSFVVTHNLGTQDLAVTIRETASPYAQVITDVEFTTTSTATVKFAVAPTSGQYTITLVG